MSDKKTIKFGNICHEVKLTSKDPIADGYERYIGLEHLDSGSLKIKRWGLIEEDNPSFTRVFKKGHILLGKRRPYLKKSAVAEFDGICSGDIIVLDSNVNIDPKILPFIIQSDLFWAWAIKTSSGSLSPRTKFSSLGDYAFSASLIERQHEVIPLLSKSKLILDSCHELIASSERLYEALDYELGRVIFSAPSMQLGQLAIKADDGPFGSKLKTEHYVEFEGARVIRLQNIQKNYFDGSDTAYVDMLYAKNELKKHEVVFNDVLIAGLGDDSFPVGRSCLYDSVLPAINKADCFRIRVDQEIILPQFLTLVLNSKHMARLLKPYIQGVTRQRINLSNLKKLPIPVPSAEDQNAFIQMLNKVSIVKKQLINKSEQTERLLKTLVASF